MAGHVLLTGASSFTGLWIAEALARAGFQVTAPLRRARADYDDLRLERVERLTQSADVVFETPFGSSALMPRMLSMILSSSGLLQRCQLRGG